MTNQVTDDELGRSPAKDDEPGRHGVKFMAAVYAAWGVRAVVVAGSSQRKSSGGGLELTEGDGAPPQAARNAPRQAMSAGAMTRRARPRRYLMWPEEGHDWRLPGAYSIAFDLTGALILVPSFSFTRPRWHLIRIYVFAFDSDRFLRSSSASPPRLYHLGLCPMAASSRSPLACTGFGRDLQAEVSWNVSTSL